MIESKRTNEILRGIEYDIRFSGNPDLARIQYRIIEVTGNALLIEKKVNGPRTKPRHYRPIYIKLDEQEIEGKEI